MGILILGIDEAGRGPVIGPMVLAGCLITEEAQIELKKLGVKDSKELTQKRREYLSEKIKAIAETFEIVLSHPNEIDNSLHDGVNLNSLEAIKVAEIINKINKGYGSIKVIIDCPSVTIEKWTDHLKTKIETLHNLEIVCEHKADKNHVAVSAASILAKCIREKEMDRLREIYGIEIGSGYTSDPSTIRFLEMNLKKHENSDIFRKTWDTWKRTSNNLEQRKLF
jgi:ribonuclease HII